MRLWHYKLLGYLPKSQLIAQWRELNSIYKKQDNHILINYVYEYDKERLMLYSDMVIRELSFRGARVKSLDNYNEYFKDTFYSFKTKSRFENPFINHHNDRYLLQCFMNLQEKYDRGQADFDELTYTKLYNQTNNLLGGKLDELFIQRC